MSKVGKLPVLIPNGVTVSINGQSVAVKGPKGELEIKVPQQIIIENIDNKINLLVKNQDITTNILHGTYRSLINNMVHGVSEGWAKSLELVGTGYRAEVSGSDLVLTVGYSHPVKVPAPEGISYKIEKNIVTVSGIDKIIVGEVAAKVRSVRPPEPYKGKGIKYTDEVVRRKAGKAAKAGGA